MLNYKVVDFSEDELDALDDYSDLENNEAVIASRVELLDHFLSTRALVADTLSLLKERSRVKTKSHPFFQDNLRKNAYMLRLDITKLCVSGFFREFPHKKDVHELLTGIEKIIRNKQAADLLTKMDIEDIGKLLAYAKGQ